MIRAILFDMGGTLDGAGVHWLDRFAALYRTAGADLQREQLRSAFDDAERRAAVDEEIGTAHLEPMLDRHVSWQLAHLETEYGAQLAPFVRQQVVEGFVRAVRTAAAESVRTLAALADRGMKLGVVSNGCGNVDVLCVDLGYAPYLSAIVDSRRVGLYKPNPAIFIHAAAKLGVAPGDAMMVGDSLDRDITPAKTIGMTTAWIEGDAPRLCPDPSIVDVRLRRLSELTAVIDRAQVCAG